MSRAMWRAVYYEWKYWNPEISKNQRKVLVRGCEHKLAYSNFLMAMLAACSAERILGGFWNCYYCPICHHQHIGRRKGKTTFFKDIQ